MLRTPATGRRSLSRTGASLVVALSCAALLVGCGSGTGGADAGSAPSASASPSAPSSAASSPTAAPSSSAADPAPACGRIWTPGKRLPRHYAGCREGTRVVEAHQLACESGQQLVTYGAHYWSVRGGPISRVGSLRTDADYLSARETCIG